MTVPFIDISRFEEGFLDEWYKKVERISEAASFVGGEEVSALESTITAYLSVGHSITCGNGTDALQLALRAIGAGDGDIVVIPDMTFWATFEAVVNVGARVVTVDIDMKDGGVDLDCLESALVKYNPKAVVIAHLFGWGSSDVSSIRELCERRGVILIEDGAQAFGVKLDGKSIYSSAHVSTISFYPAKVLGAAGDGGAVIVEDEGLALKIRQLANHGRATHYGHDYVGWNSRLDALNAAYLNLSMKYIDRRIQSRVNSMGQYRDRWKSESIELVSPPSGYQVNGYSLVTLMSDAASRIELEGRLVQAKIGFGNIYPSPMSKQPAATQFLVGQVGGERAIEWCQRVLNLPLFAYMTQAEIDKVLEVTNDA